MKKLLFFVAVATFATGTMVSCGKSSKGKLDNEWKIDAAEHVTTTTNGGNTSTNTQKISGTTITNTSVNGGTTTTTTGTVNESRWTIKKDGTWERVLSFTFTETFLGNTLTNTTSIIESGSWDFFAGVGEFKKNERIVFNTLNSKTVASTTYAGDTDTETTLNTYQDGEVSEIFVITESTKKALAFEFTGGTTDVITSGGSTTTSSSTSKKTFSMSVN